MAKTGGIAQTSIYLSVEDREVVRELQERTGLGRSAVIRLALRNLYEGDAGMAARLANIKRAADEIAELTSL